MLPVIALLALSYAHLASAVSTNACFAMLASQDPAQMCGLDAAGCMCNSAFRVMVPSNALAGISAMCGFPAQPTCIPSYDYGCPISDDIVDVSRLGTFLGYLNYLLPIYNAPYEESCFDKTACVNFMSTIFVPGVTVKFPYGLGAYTGVEDACDYLGIPAAGISRDLYKITTTPTPQDYVIFGPTSMILGSMNYTVNVIGKPFTNLFQEFQLGFPTCDAKLSRLESVPYSNVLQRPTDSWQISSGFYQAVKYDLKQFNEFDICRTHEKYCKGDNKQYKNYAECRKYIDQLPIRAQGCSPAELLYGPSKTCKLKHSLMVPINPDLHCSHIGKIGAEDYHGNHKCTMQECPNAQTAPVTWEQIDALDFSAQAQIFKERERVPPKVCDSGNTDDDGDHHSAATIDENDDE